MASSPPSEPAAGALGGRAGLGRRPALLVVDMSCGFTDPAAPLACDVSGAIDAIVALLKAARRSGVPVTFTTVAYGEEDLATAAVFLDKVPALRMLRAGSRWVGIDPRISPTPGERVLVKLFASAFFGTGLAAALRSDKVDSVLVTGASTSGCVRATVVDALQHGFRPAVAREAVADRDRRAHDQSLVDIDGRYGDVVPVERAHEWIGGHAGRGSPRRGAG